MTRFQTGPTLEPHDPTRWQQAADEYEQSDSFMSDAIEWIGDARQLPAALVDSICAHYLDSTAFATVIDDALNGEVKWD